MNRKYHLPDSDLIAIALRIHSFMLRDSVQFAARGVDADEMNAYKDKINNFKSLLSDSYYNAIISGNAKTKSNIRTTAIMKIQLISGYFEQMWGRGGSIYKLLRIKNLHGMKDNDLLVTCSNVASVASDYLASLSDIGLTQSDIDSLTSEARKFEDVLNLIAKNKALRLAKKRERIQLANELYLYVKKYSSTGKIIWENINITKYNNYLIYKNRGARASFADESVSEDVFAD